MRLAFAALLMCLTGAVIVLSTGPAAAQSCDQLGYERNSIYKQEGYCFKTPRAIATFGNAGCRYDIEAQVPLSPGERERIAAIADMERAYGCN
jgi:hypothetical protein